MTPHEDGYEHVCMECSMCSFYWGNSCPGLKKFRKQDCIDMEQQ